MRSDFSALLSINFWPRFSHTRTLNIYVCGLSSSHSKGQKNCEIVIFVFFYRKPMRKNYLLLCLTSYEMPSFNSAVIFSINYRLLVMCLYSLDTCPPSCGFRPATDSKNTALYEYSILLIRDSWESIQQTIRKTRVISYSSQECANYDLWVVTASVGCSYDVDICLPNRKYNLCLLACCACLHI